MMTVYLKQKHNIRLNKTRVGKALKAVAPINNQSCRSRISWAVNLIPYHVYYLGYKIHFDQNEKLIAHRAKHVAATDGHRRYIVGTCTMPIQNNMVIYKKLYRSFFQ